MFCLLAEETPKTLFTDPWTFGLLVVALLGSGLSLAFSLGYNLAKLTNQENRLNSLDATIKAIFQRLDELAKALPHQCIQVKAMAEVQAQVAINTRRIEDIEAWRPSQRMKDEG
jgi:hypothetical protein